MPDKPNKPSDLLKDYANISSLSKIFTRLNEAINNPKSSAGDIGNIIKDDPGLTARLLRIVNSPFYGFPQKIETISRAIVIVGLQQLRDLALGTSIVDVFKGIPEHFLSMDSFWRHSISCGVAAKILATYRRETNAERFFVSGILHDLGRLIILTNIPELARETLLRCKSRGDLLHVAEREVIGFDHAAVGRALLRAWKLPPSLEEVVAFHHKPTGVRRFPVEVAIVHVADILAHSMQFGNSGEPSVPPLDGEAWESIGLPVSVLSPPLDQLELQVNDVLKTIIGDE